MALVHGELTRRIIACFYEVHRELGSGFPESVYSRAMEIVMTEAEVGLLLQFFAKPKFQRFFMSNENKKNRRGPLLPRLSALQKAAEREASRLS